jgi:hypothetical protein
LLIVSAMNSNDVSNMYADSPERMLYLSILLLVAVALFMLSNRRWGKKTGVRPTASPAELPAGTSAARGPLSQWLGPERERRPG